MYPEPRALYELVRVHDILALGKLLEAHLGSTYNITTSDFVIFHILIFHGYISLGQNKYNFYHQCLLYIS